MNRIPYRSLGVTAFLFLLGCQGMPKASTTGHVIDVAILDNERPGDIALNPGDEVRWINKQSTPVQVIFIDAVSNKKVSCKNHFGGFMTPGNTAELAPNLKPPLEWIPTGRRGKLPFRELSRWENKAARPWGKPLIRACLFDSKSTQPGVIRL